MHYPHINKRQFNPCIDILLSIQGLICFAKLWVTSLHSCIWLNYLPPIMVNAHTGINRLPSLLNETSKFVIR